MAENLTAFHARVDGFQRSSLPENGWLTTRDGLRDKVDDTGALRPFYGSTVIYDLDAEAKLELANRQTGLYHRCGRCLAEPLHPAFFHLTLHDLTSSTQEQEAWADAARVRDAAENLISALRRQGIPEIHMVSTQMFSMVNTSVVQGFAPETEADCAALMGLYERFHEVVPLAWGLTPHVTLGYYRPGVYGPDETGALAEVFRRAAQLPPLRMVLRPDALAFALFRDMNSWPGSPGGQSAIELNGSR